MAQNVLQTGLGSVNDFGDWIWTFSLSVEGNAFVFLISEIFFIFNCNDQRRI